MNFLHFPHKSTCAAFLIALLSLLSAPFSSAAETKLNKLSPAEIAEAATPSVVLIKLENGLGSGFVVSKDGKIVTNLHVIRGAKEATVVAADGREFKNIEVMAFDVAQDLAVLRIGDHGIKALNLGDSSSAKPGQHVVAIGHPLGLGNTVSDGLVSAIRELTPKRVLLQISAPISPGSSGGPLFNDVGEVIGISTLVITTGQNLNFAVPIDIVKPLLATKNGISLAAFGAQNSNGRRIPNHPLALLDACSPPQIQSIASEIERAINLGAPLYNSGNVEACYRIYAGVALDLNKKADICTGPKRALLDGVQTADKLDDWSAKAWAMRDAFDGLLAVFERKATAIKDENKKITQERKTIAVSSTVLNDCSGEEIGQMQSNIISAINVGAPLYNSGNIEACYRIYEGAINNIERKVKACSPAKQLLQGGVQEADKQQTWEAKSWALRDAFDGILKAIDQKK